MTYTMNRQTRVLVLVNQLGKQMATRHSNLGLAIVTNPQAIALGIANHMKMPAAVGEDDLTRAEELDPRVVAAAKAEIAETAARHERAKRGEVVPADGGGDLRSLIEDAKKLDAKPARKVRAKRKGKPKPKKETPSAEASGDASAEAAKDVSAPEQTEHVQVEATPEDVVFERANDGGASDGVFDDLEQDWEGAASAALSGR